MLVAVLVGVAGVGLSSVFVYRMIRNVLESITRGGGGDKQQPISCSDQVTTDFATIYYKKSK